MMKLDLHVHTKYSADCSIEPEQYLKLASKIGLQGFAITDHNVIAGARKFFKLTKNRKDIAVIPGIEISSSYGHILGYGITEQIPRGLDPKETVERISDLGGIAVAAHPYRMVSGLGPGIIRKVNFQTVETLNHRSPKRENQRAGLLALELKSGITGGSDAHHTWELGLAATEFNEQINVNRIDDILEEISKKRTKPIGESSTMVQGLHMYGKLVVHWLKRGFKRV
jgi:predicted metal-dependent phosphoesterase TrpH